MSESEPYRSFACRYCDRKLGCHACRQRKKRKVAKFHKLRLFEVEDEHRRKNWSETESEEDRPNSMETLTVDDIRKMREQEDTFQNLKQEVESLREIVGKVTSEFRVVMDHLSKRDTDLSELASVISDSK